MKTSLTNAVEGIRPFIEVDFKILLSLYEKRLPAINKLLRDSGRPEINLGQSLETASNLVQAILYYEYCVATDQPCIKQYRSLFQCLFFETSTSSAEQVFRTALTPKHAVPVLLEDGIETINWNGIVLNGKSRLDRRFLDRDAFDQQIASQNHTCWGYIDRDGVHQHSCNTIVQQGNGNTEQGHQPSINETLIVAQCRSCNRRQTIADRDRGVYK